MRSLYIFELPFRLAYIILLATWMSATSLADEIDLHSMPRCGWSDCFPYHSAAIGCAAITDDCFCNALAPVNCTATNCIDGDWYSVEDWFNLQCGPPQNVTLQLLPQCGRACIRNALIPEHCQSQLTRNCFCRLEAVFDSLAPCLVNDCGESIEEADETMRQFYRNTCVYVATPDGNGEPGGGGEVIESPETDDESSSSTTNKVGLIAGIVASFIGIIVFIVAVWIWCGRHAAAVSHQLEIQQSLFTDSLE